MRTDPGGWTYRWDAEAAARMSAAGIFPDKTVGEFAAERAAAHPDRVQIVDCEREFTCAEIYAGARRLAAWFIAQGFTPGQVISYQLPNWHEANIIDLAASLAGLVVHPILPIHREAEATYMLNDCRSRLVFIPAEFRRFDYRALMRKVLPGVAVPPRVVVLRGDAQEFMPFAPLLEASDRGVTFPKVDANAVKIIMYTSGTTGRPKGVLHSHNTLHATVAKSATWLGLTPERFTLNPSPITHVTGALYALVMPWHSDIPVVLMDVWEAERAFDLMLKYNCAFMGGATPFLQELVAVSERRGQPLPLRFFGCGGAAVPPALIHRANQLFPNCRAYRGYGATEVPSLAVGPRDPRYAAETDGCIYRGEMKVVDLATGAPLPDGEEGEILARAPNMMLGYARESDNVEAYDEEGYFRMGDIGKRVFGNHVLITGRKKDLIIRAGENLSAKEIEDALHRHPAVQEAAVVSMPSRRTGEGVCAFIIAKPGQTVTLPHIAAFIAECGLAKQKTPEHVQIVPDFPRTGSGKIRKDLLRETAKGFPAL
jgi:acyl-CoA synthetase (AMP-forming)/AMP-acid ligase II